MANDPYILFRTSNCLYLVYTVNGNLYGTQMTQILRDDAHR